MGGKPCIKGLRMTVGTVWSASLGLKHNRNFKNVFLFASEDIIQALAYAAWRSEEIEVPLATA